MARTQDGTRASLRPPRTETRAALEDHRSAQRREREAARETWHDHDLVFTLPDGRPLHPERVTRMFARRVRQAELSQIRLHDLRHGFATMALAAGVNPKVVSDVLGHATVGFTLDAYTHAVPALEEDATERVAALIARRSLANRLHEPPTAGRELGL